MRDATTLAAYPAEHLVRYVGAWSMIALLVIFGVVAWRRRGN